MRVLSHIGVAALLGIAGLASAQSQRLVFIQANSEYGGYGVAPTAPDVAVSGLATVVCSNTRLALYPKSIALPAPPPDDLRELPDQLVSPFVLSDATFDNNRFIDPRATYDAHNDRLWVIYIENDGDLPYSGCGPISRLHVSVSKDPADFGGGPLDTLADTHWWYYTGPEVMTNPRPSWELEFSSFHPYKNEQLTHSGVRSARLPTIAVDGGGAGPGAAIVTPNTFIITCGAESPLPGQMNQKILIIPLEHDDGGSTVSILDGHRPGVTDITLLDLATNPPASLDRRADSAEAAYAVQEPYEEYDNAVFLVSGISTRLDFSVAQSKIRLKGLFYDDTAPAGEKWTLQQRIDGSGAIEDMPLNTPFDTLAFHATPSLVGLSPIGIRPRTPDTGMGGWGPAAEGYIFHSAVLCKDVNGNDRIFAVHAVHPDDDGDLVPQWVVQWYVIDPQLTSFRQTPAPSNGWNPSIVAAGRIAVEDADCYHPEIIVNRQGVAFVEYTFSKDTTWPQIRRVRLDSSYTGVVSGTDVPVRSGAGVPYREEAGPGVSYPLQSWATYAGSQADPMNNCAYWSVHTLAQPEQTLPPPSDTTKRNVVLYHQAYSNSTGPNCFQTTSMLDLNDDNEVDEYDMLEFTPMFDRRARRVDIDGNGVVDATDALLFTDAYRGYTGR